MPLDQATKNLLIELGLGENEAFLYEVLLENADATIPLIQKKTPFSRTMAYYVVNNLIAMELAKSHKKGKKTVYNAEHPQKLLELVKNQELELAQAKKSLEGLLPRITSQFRLTHNKPGIQFFEGKEGIQAAIFDSLTATETIRQIINLEAVEEFIPDIAAKYAKKREKLGIQKKVLAIDTPESRKLLKRDLSKHITDLFLPAEMNVFKTSVMIYDHKVVYLTFRKDNLLAIITEDKDIYEMHKSIFDYLWDKQLHKFKKHHHHPHTPPDTSNTMTVFE